ncbi:MAG: orotate phosphoribosyltransferase [Sulfolobales archaeon]|nr:orotate phosphoribosyltransferase [Sulfolobales archaeon]MCX8209271.1 orotate phosphoribosyltransferase [Sulfolobales archaeon]MDW8011094.1 orotate phosphoribosyltransferase [Sulfolobales archaeon]
MPHELCLEAVKLGLVKFGRFKLSSGIESSYYVNFREATMVPSYVKRVAYEIGSAVVREGVEAVVGVAVAGALIASYVGALFDLPVTFVRSEPKNHGLGREVEGCVENMRIAIVDDVLTTGGTIRRAYEALVNSGSKPVVAAVVFNRQQGGGKTVRELGLKLISLCDISSLASEALKRGLISGDQYELIVSQVVED